MFQCSTYWTLQVWPQGSWKLVEKLPTDFQGFWTSHGRQGVKMNLLYMQLISSGMAGLYLRVEFVSDRYHQHCSNVYFSMSIQILLLHLENEVGTAWWLIETLQFSITFTLHRGQGWAHAIKSPYRACLNQAVDVSFVLKPFSRTHSHKIIHLCGSFCLKKRHPGLLFSGDKLPLNLIKTK